MKARVQEMRAKVVQAQAAVPLAMADALRAGNLGGLLPTLGVDEGKEEPGDLQR